jgi:O-antigen polymerase
MIQRNRIHLDLDMLLAFMVLLTTSILFTTHFIHPFIPIKEIAFQALVLIAAVIYGYRFLQMRIGLTDVLVTLWITWQLITIAISSGISGIWCEGQGSIFLMLFYLLVRTINLNRLRYESIANAVVSTALFQAIIGLLQFANLFPWTSQLYQGFESQVTGTVGGANFLAAFLAISLPFFYHHIKKCNGLKNICLWSIGLIVVLMALVLTKSRGAWIASLAGVAVYCAPLLYHAGQRLKKRKIYNLLILAIATIGAIYFLQAIYNLNRSSANGRLFIWSVTWNMIQDHWVAGVGYGQFKLHWLDYQGAYFARDLTSQSHSLAVSLTSAHSQFLHTFAETGLMGLMLFLSAVSSVLIRANRSLRNQHEYTTGHTIVYASALVTLLVHGLVEDVLVSIPIQVLFFTILASAATSKEDKTLPDIAYKPHWAYLSRAVLLSILAVNVHGAYNVIRGELVWKKGQEYAKVGKWEQGIKKYIEAAAFLPNNAELKFYIGAAYSRINRPDLALNYLKDSQNGFIDKNQFIALGKSYIDSGQYMLAEQSLKEALYFYPELLSPHFWLSRIYFEKGNLTKAREELYEVLKGENPHNSASIDQVQKDARLALERLNNFND